MAELVGSRVYSCCTCRNHVCLHDDIISMAFQVRMSLDVHWCSKRIKVLMVAIFERFCYASKSYELCCASYPLSFVATCV
ncbi:hypothetical protein SORBI_3005G115000 [Sorghum bicolor]|uniref:Yippee domain-containing protein n=2 Tax=Sorghum bicolor TaxID=4558 RepID=A0A1B6PRS6_SORBI|nr:hypothetical protein SORBI_3005G115000 [Sorghum bicolor]